jgi:hypothetical protein
MLPNGGKGQKKMKGGTSLPALKPDIPIPVMSLRLVVVIILLLECVLPAVMSVEVVIILV